jgi:hypothetical protein
MQLKETPVCPKTAEKPDFIESAWMCKESALEMRFEDDQWVCDQCVASNTKAGKQREIDKPRPPTKSAIEEGKRKAREDFEKQKRKNEAEELEREEQERQNYPRPRGG